jgi:hypothetical protein
MTSREANKLLGVLKLFYKEDPIERYGAWEGHDSTVYDDFIDWYDEAIPRPIRSLGFEDEFIQSLILYNHKDFDNWGKMGDQVEIPKKRNYTVDTEVRGAEYVRRNYELEFDAYNDADMKRAIYNCEPCYDEGEQTDYEIEDTDVNYEILDYNYIEESDINRIVSKILKS